MRSCSTHREYLAAIADGELALVPAGTLEHVKDCDHCAREIDAHRLIGSRLREAADVLGDRSPAPRISRLASTRVRLAAAGVAAAILVAATSAGWFILSRPDPVQAAVDATTQPMQIATSDSLTVAQWCRQATGKNLPMAELDGMKIEGARMDHSASTDIVTVVYTAPSGDHVTVSWLEGQAPAGSGVEEASRSGHELLIVHSSVGTAVVTGSSSDAMWQAAEAIETAAA